jgi:UDP-glucose 4-epimerase
MRELTRVLVTGGAGFIGSHVVDRLVGSGCEVIVVDNLSAGVLANIEEHVREGRVCFVRGDIRDSETVGKCVHGVDAVVHLAAVTSVPFSVEHPALTFENNVDGTLNLLNWCVKVGVGRFVFVSSCSVYGEPNYLPVDEKHPTCPCSPYASSKLEGERQCRNFEERYGLETVALRLFNVYGPRQGLSSYSGVVTQFVNRARQGSALVIFGDGRQTRDFVHAYDVADAVLRSLKGESDGEVFNIGSGRPTSLNSLAKSVLNLAGANLDIVYEKPRVGDVKASFADISKAEKQLDYKPIVPLEKGLRSMVEEAC